MRPNRGGMCMRPYRGGMCMRPYRGGMCMRLHVDMLGRSGSLVLCNSTVIQCKDHVVDPITPF